MRTHELLAAQVDAALPMLSGAFALATSGSHVGRSCVSFGDLEYASSMELLQIPITIILREGPILSGHYMGRIACGGEQEPVVELLHRSAIEPRTIKPFSDLDEMSAIYHLNLLTAFNSLDLDL